MGLLSALRKKEPQWVYVPNAQILPIGNSMRINHGRYDYVLYHLASGYFCTQGSCSHEFSPLWEGYIMKDCVYCPKHGSRFCIKTGAVKDLPATTALKTYPVRQDSHGIAVLIL